MKQQKQITIIITLVLFVYPLSSIAGENSLVQHYKQQVIAQESRPLTLQNTEEKTNFSQKIEETKKRWQALVAGSVHKQPSSFGNSLVQQWLSTNEQKVISQLKKSITFDLLVACVVKENLELQEARKQWEAALESFSQADYLDQIRRQYQAFYQDIRQIAAESFPFPTVTSLKGDLALKKVEIARLHYQITLKKIVRELEITFYERIFLARKDQIIFENIVLLKKLETSILSQYNTAKAGYSNLIKINILLEKMETNLKNNRREEETSLAAIRFLLNLPAHFSLGIFTPPVLVSEEQFVLDHLYKKGIKNREELAVLRKRIEKTNIAITMAKRKLFPRFQLPVQESTRPFPPHTRVWFSTGDAYVREALLHYQALQKRLDSDIIKLRYQLAEELEVLAVSNQNMALYRDKLIKLSDNDLRVSLKDYQGELAGFMDVLEAEKSLLTYQLSFAKSVKENRQSQARLRALIGTTFAHAEGNDHE